MVGTVTVAWRWWGMTDNRIVAVGLLSARDLERLGPGFARAYPVVGDHVFDDLIALDRIAWNDGASVRMGKAPNGTDRRPGMGTMANRTIAPQFQHPFANFPWGRWHDAGLSENQNSIVSISRRPRR